MTQTPTQSAHSDDALVAGGAGFNAAWYLVDRWVEQGRGHAPALRCEGRDVSYAELQVLTSQVVDSLERLGLRRGERVLFFMADGIELAAGILGAMRGGFIAVPVNTMLTGDDLGTLVRDSGAHVVLCSGDFAAAAREACDSSHEARYLVVAGDGTADAAAGTELLTWAEWLVPAAEKVTPPVAAGDDSSALWLYTSGTTGKPKAAMHRHANIRHVCQTYGRSTLRIGPSDRSLSVAKLFFAYGIGNSLFFPLSVGACGILEPRRPTPQVIAERIGADGPTIFHAVPAFFSAMLAADLPEGQLDGVRIATSAGEALPAALQARWTERFGVSILDGLGSTEALHIFLSNAEGDIGPGTSGRAVPGYDLQVRDESGALVEPGTPGSLFVRGESIASGYWGRTEATRAMFQGEWLATGDTYLVDDDGRYVCLGRSGDMIKAGGIWVTPSEVEARLLEHPDVLEAAVVGGHDADGLERPVACVVVREGATASEPDLIEHCRGGMAHFKAPRAVLFVDALPRTATGKLQRFAVRHLVDDANPLHAPTEPGA